MVGEDRKRGIIAHGAERLFSRTGTGTDEESHVLKAVAKGLLAGEDGKEVVGVGMLWGGEVLSIEKVVPQPLAIGSGLGHFLLQLGIVHDAPEFHVHKEHASWFETALLYDVGGLDGRQHAHL